MHRCLRVSEEILNKLVFGSLEMLELYQDNSAIGNFHGACDIG